MSLTVFLLSIFIHVQILIKQRIDKFKIEQELQAEAGAFFHYLEREMDDTSQIFISSGRIFFFSKGQRFDYKQSGDKIIRKKNDSGYVAVCLNVKSFRSYLVHQGLSVQLILEKHGVKQQIETVVHYYLPGNLLGEGSYVKK